MTSQTGLLPISSPVCYRAHRQEFGQVSCSYALGNRYITHPVLTAMNGGRRDRWQERLVVERATGLLGAAQRHRPSLIIKWITRNLPLRSLYGTGPPTATSLLIRTPHYNTVCQDYVRKKSKKTSEVYPLQAAQWILQDSTPAYRPLCPLETPEV